jgi:hypothetical protein
MSKVSYVQIIILIILYLIKTTEIYLLIAIMLKYLHLFVGYNNSFYG